MELEWKAWLEWGSRDFAKELSEALDELDPHWEHELSDEDQDKSTLYTLWHDGCDAYNVNGGTGYINGQGDSIHFYIDEWIECATESEHPIYKWSEWARKARAELHDKLMALAVASRTAANCCG